MPKKILLLFFLTSFFCFISKAQQIKPLTGSVIDSETLENIPGAVIEVYQGKDLIFSVIANADGTFTIPDNFWTLSNSIRITGKNYHDLIFFIKDIEPQKNANEDKLVLGSFKLRSSVVHLKEVQIKARKRYRDTTIISFANQTFVRSVMIDDIFAQKGLYKGGNGQLYYNGKLVSQVVVNGGDFFGKNNLDIYDKLPALILDKIEVTETNIDSITNTTRLSPAVKIDLKIKDKYNKGAFGSATVGLGTRERQIFNTDLYTYRKRQQISVTGGTNNIGLAEGLGEPVLGLSVSGNNADNRYLKLTYHNVIGQKTDVNFQSKIKQENRLFFYGMERNDEAINQFSKTKSSSLSKLLSIDNSQLSLNFKIDSLNTIQYNNEFHYDDGSSLDSLSYLIRSGSTIKSSVLSKNRGNNNGTLSTNITYNKKFRKAGRSLQTIAYSQISRYNTNEVSNILDTAANNLITGKNTAQNIVSSITTNFTEPLNEDMYIRINASYKNDQLSFTSASQLNSLPLTPPGSDKIVNNYFRFGSTLQKTFHKVSVDGALNAIMLNRDIRSVASDRSTLLNLDADLRIDSRITPKKNITLLYTLKPTYPNINQLTSINSSFDLISKTSGNIQLRPEVKHRLSFVYDNKRSDSLSFFFSAEANYYASRFGLNSVTNTGTTQNVIIYNIGSSRAGIINLMILKIFPHIGMFNYNLNFNYNELPNIINNVKQQTNGFILTQSLSTVRNYFSNKFFITPSFSSAYSRYTYNGTVQSSMSITYTDKFAFKLSNFEMSIYPFANMVTGINKNVTWAINSEVRKKILKNYGVIWIKANDIFNSFSYQYNSFGPSYTQTVSYSNLSRYFLAGITLKFNNIK